MKRYKSLFTEERYSYEKSEWVAVINDNTNMYGLFAFRDERSAEKFIDIVENISDITIFQTEYYGSADLLTVEEYYKNNNVHYVDPDSKNSIKNKVKMVVSILN